MASKKTGGFQPKRRPDKSYRPVQIRKKQIRDTAPGNPQKFVELNPDGSVKDLEAAFGSLGAEVVEAVRNEREQKRQQADLGGNFQRDEVEESLRMLDYYISDQGSLEDRVGERKALAADEPTEEGRAQFMAEMKQMVDEGTLRDLCLDPETVAKNYPTNVITDSDWVFDKDADKDDDPEVYFDPNQLAFGDWSEMLVTVDRNVKLWRGGRLESYRALVVGGNLNGCKCFWLLAMQFGKCIFLIVPFWHGTGGGFGVGKSTDPMEAVTKASRKTKRNIFFVDRYQGDGITSDLVGKQNSCKSVIRSNDRGLRGNELMREILKRFGITNASCKSYGKRNPYNVVLATFKALMTHESLEDIALKRGKRIMSLDRAIRLQI